MRDFASQAQRFRLRYGRDPQYIGYAPGRVSVIGGHMDYNGGPVIAAALPVGTVVSIAHHSDGVIRITSQQQESPATIHCADPNISDQPTWTRYILGVLKEFGVGDSGFDIDVSSELPMGRGLASSAALTAATAMAVFQIAPNKPNIDVMRLCQYVEHHYVGVKCGILDQYSAIHGREGSLLNINCASESHKYLPFPHQLAIVVCDSGMGRELAKGFYNVRRSECRAAAEAAGKKSLTKLNNDDIARLPKPEWRKRAKHVVSEARRVHDFERSLRSSDFELLRQTMAAAHASCRDFMECSTPELDFLVDRAANIPQCVGARLTGAGWGGATINLVQRDAVEDFCGQLARAYRQELGRSASFFIAPRPGMPAYGVTFQGAHEADHHRL